MPVAPAPAPTTPATRYPLALAYCCGAFLLGDFLGYAGLPPALPLLLALLLGLVLWRWAGWRLGLLGLCCGLALALGCWRYVSSAYHHSPAEVPHYTDPPVQTAGGVDGE